MVNPDVPIPSSFVSSINSRRMTSFHASSHLAVGTQSLLPVSTSFLRQAFIRRHFIALQKESRFPGLVHKQVSPLSTPSSTSPTSMPVCSKLHDKLVKRREARKARSRPWVHPPRSSATSSECQSSVSPSFLPDAPHATEKVPDQLKKKPPDVSTPREELMASEKKRLSFGEVTVIGHQCWINPSEHVVDLPSQDPVERRTMPATLSAHDALYWPDWALRKNPQLDIHLAGECANPNCAWNSVAQYRRWLPSWSNVELFRSWSFVAIKLNKR